MLVFFPYWHEQAIIYLDPEHPKHAQRVTCLLSLQAVQELGVFIFQELFTAATCGECRWINGTAMGLRISAQYLYAFKWPSVKCTIFFVVHSLCMPTSEPQVHYWSLSSQHTDISIPSSMIYHTICLVRWKLRLICEENTSLVCKIRWAFAHCTQVMTSLRMSSTQFVTDYAEILWLFKPAVASAVWGAGLGWLCRWRSRMWSLRAGVTTRGLQFGGQLDALPNSQKQQSRCFTLEPSVHRQHLWLTFLQSACQLPPQNVQHLCCVVW